MSRSLSLLLRVGACSLLLAWIPPLWAQPGSARPQVGEAARPPSVLLVITDDQGWGDVYSHGNDRIDTPVMDRLAIEGARFNRFYVSPVCAPTRAALLTGRYFLRTGVADVTRGLETMRAGEVTMAEVFRQAGYRTGAFGKWHNGAHFPHDPLGQGFDRFFGFTAGHWNDYYDPTLTNGREPVETDGYIADVLTDAAIRFIEENRAQPFFCYVAYNTPHAPYQVPDRYYDKYRARGFDEKTAAVYGMVENLDDNLGRLLHALDGQALREETIVLFMTDNGPNGDRFNGGMRGRKGRVDEGGVRVPLFIRWPGRVPEGRLIRELADHIDLLPTLAELTGVSMPEAKPLDGISLAPLLLGRPAAWPDRMLFTHRGGARGGGLDRFPGAVRTDRYRLVCYEEPCALYDMLLDPRQERDIAPEAPERAAALRAAYDGWFAEVTREDIVRPAIPVGYEEAPVVELPAVEAYFTGGMAYANKQGYAHDWLTGRPSEADSVWWEVDVVRPGRYEVQLAYAARGRTALPVRIEAAGDILEGALRPAGPEAPSIRRDRDPEARRFVQAFALHRLGTIDLQAGRQPLTFGLGRAIPSGSLALLAVRLKRLP